MSALLNEVVPNEKICSVEGCESTVIARGWCSSHYKRWWTHGHPLAGGAFRPRDNPTSDPNSLYPGRRFTGGRWRTEAEIESRRRASREWRKRNRDYFNERKARLMEMGMCSSCETRPLATKWLCNECADKLLTPEQLLKARRRQALQRKAARLERSMNG